MTILKRPIEAKNQFSTICQLLDYFYLEKGKLFWWKKNSLIV